MGPNPAPTRMALTVVENRTGCVVCDAAIVYLAVAERLACALCGEEHHTETRCAAGHYVCDRCHSGSANDLVERACVATSLTDPLQIARSIMQLPAVKMHGPEHHFLVPAALLAAWCNARGEPERKPALVAEARRRSAPVLGGFCGLQGACGAAIGTGTFVALAIGSTPLKGKERSLANRMTAKALEAISRTEGARCCKRDCFLAILAAARFAKEHLHVALPARGAPCTFAEMNTECQRNGCPFYRAA